MARTVIGDWEAPRDNNQYREQNIESVITVTTPDPAGVGGLARQAAAVARQNGLLVGMINGGGATVARSDTEWI
ncbi:MAG TPA: hypothetical protein VJX67_09395, partial [Blastocatellia bacterium]|nr:hypothetical protein [Blastocatellia bacterium]